MIRCWSLEMGIRSSELNAMMASVLVEARWLARDVLSRREAAAAIELLDAHAAELALSSAARDQLLSVALTAAVCDVTAKRDVLVASPTIFISYDDDLEHARSVVRRDVFNTAPKTWPMALDVAVSLLQSLAEAPSGDKEAESGTSRLQCILRMQELLWDHPHIPATPDTRLAMLFSVPVLKGLIDGRSAQQERYERVYKHSLRPGEWSRRFTRRFQRLFLFEWPRPFRASNNPKGNHANSPPSRQITRSRTL